MKPLPLRRHTALAALTAVAGIGPSTAQTLDLAQAPLFLTTNVRPNLMVVYDNSQSMDGTMAGKLIAGDDPSTRGNIARRVLRSAITTYRSAFQWGAASFAVVGSPQKYTTYGYYFGTDAEVQLADTCVGGKATQNGNLPCVENPDPGSAYHYITYGPNKTGDDPSINDVLYTVDWGPTLWGIGAGPKPTNYTVFKQRTTSSPSDWSLGDFSGALGTWDFTPTDAGYLPTSPPDHRMVWTRRAWGYLNAVTGGGTINRGAAADSPAQYDALMALLAPETSVPGDPEIKNSALFTPLSGTLDTVRSYFTGKSTPISQSCQKNFVLLATDGNPTSTKTGDMYSLADQKNTLNGSTWSFSAAATEVFDSITALRSFSVGGNGHDAKTYVVGLGDSVANPSSIAALNEMASRGGTGNAYLASDEVALAEAFRKISNDIISQTASASAVALNGSTWTDGSRTFQARFNSGDWSGQLLAYNVAADGTLSADSHWTDPGQGLNQQDWDTGRQILSFNKASAQGVAFRWPANPASPATNELGADMVAALNRNLGGTADGLGADRLAYLRGNRSKEQQNCSSCTPAFRNRSSVLGDIVDSTPAYVAGGTGFYREGIDKTASYAGYKADQASRTPMVYVGANDGMLHAFDATSGAEVFAYVPAAVAHRLSAPTDPAYAHRYSVDGSPAVGDVVIGGKWRTLLVSGMNAGAKGLFALDITDPAKFTESNAADIVRWEVDGSDADVGHIFGSPTLTKTKAGWKAIAGNGYNSSNGHAVLLVLDVATGQLTKIDTGNVGTINGLSEVVAVSSNASGVTDIVYAGDLSGRLWKFDLSSADSAQWTVAYRGKPLFTAAAGQAITAKPAVTPGTVAGSFIVTLGTGRYVDSGDTAAGGVQALYGIIDNQSTVALGDLQLQSITASNATGQDGKTYRLTTHAVGPAADSVVAGDNAISAADYATSKKGWRLDLPSGGERVVTAATVRNGRVFVSTMTPNSAPCSSGGDGWVLELAVTTGNRWDDGSLDTNSDGKVDVKDRLSGVTVSGVYSPSIPTRTVILRKPADASPVVKGSANCETGITNTSGGAAPDTACHVGSKRTSHRANWEQIR